MDDNYRTRVAFEAEHRTTHHVDGRWHLCLFGPDNCPNADHRTEHRYATPWQPTKEPTP